ncbi:MAG: hydrogenase subunit MbhD domain-containing protein [Gemmatimonadota bacterium]
MSATTGAWIFDLLLVATLVLVAWGSISAHDPFTGTVRYIAFGLLTALVWGRLAAPDLALAEAAIGAGLTGALLLSTLGRLRGAGGSSQSEPRSTLHGQLPSSPLIKATIAAAVTIFALLASTAVLALATHNERVGLADAVARLGTRSGIESAVTAVLLDLRGYDTLLETSVLFAAVLAVWGLGIVRTRPAHWPGDPVLGSVSHFLLPLLLLVAAHLLGAGLHGPGGGFQSGALLGAAGVLWTLTDRRALRLGERRRTRWGVAAGLGALLAACAWPLLRGRAPLEYAAGTAAAWGLFIEACIAVSVGLTLTALFIGGLAELPEEEG